MAGPNGKRGARRSNCRPARYSASSRKLRRSIEKSGPLIIRTQSSGRAKSCRAAAFHASTMSRSWKYCGMRLKLSWCCWKFPLVQRNLPTRRKKSLHPIYLNQTHRKTVAALVPAEVMMIVRQRSYPTWSLELPVPTIKASFLKDDRQAGGILSMRQKRHAAGMAFQRLHSAKHARDWDASVQRSASWSSIEMPDCLPNMATEHDQVEDA